MTLVEWASILFIVWGVVSGVADVAGRATELITPTTNAAGTTLSLPSPWVWAVYLAVGTAVDLAILVLLRTSFQRLVPVDRRFSSPSTLSLVALVGTVIVVIGATLLLDGLYQAVNCVGSGQPLTRACLFSGVFVGGLALVAIGAIAALVGFIGVLIGIWRLGTRHDQSLFKIAAVLLIFPFLNIVGAILMLVGTHSALEKVDATIGPPPPLGAA